MENPSSAALVAEHYSIATQVPCHVLNLQRASVEEQIEPICPLQETCSEECWQLFVTHANTALRFGGSSLFFCPHELLFWISPLLYGGTMSQALLAGPVSIDESSLSGVITVDLDRIHSLQEILRISAGWASGYVEMSMVERRQALEQQSQLSEYIQELKERERAIGSGELLEKEAHLQEAIRWGRQKRAQRLLNEILGAIFFAEGNSLERIRYRVLQLLLIISRSAIQGGGDEEQLLAETLQAQKELQKIRDRDELNQWLSLELRRYFDLVFDANVKQYGPVLARALRYLRANFEHKPTMSEAASAAHISVAHLSRLFRTRLGLTFSELVGHLRIEKASYLLLETVLPIGEIALLVGYNDQSYFSKVFQRYHNLTPTEYRSRGGTYPSETFEIHNRPPQELP